MRLLSRLLSKAAQSVLSSIGTIAYKVEDKCWEMIENINGKRKTRKEIEEEAKQREICIRISISNNTE